LNLLQSLRSLASRWSKRNLYGDTSFLDGYLNSPSATGVQINQYTALQVTSVMACVRMLAYDFAKATPEIYVETKGSPKQVAKTHPLYTLFHEPNDWMTWPDFAAMVQIGLILRGNGYAVIVRNMGGDPRYLVPINPDRVALYQASDGLHGDALGVA
jgi:HK97 family phage portal protein